MRGWLLGQCQEPLLRSDDPVYRPFLSGVGLVLFVCLLLPLPAGGRVPQIPSAESPYL